MILGKITGKITTNDFKFVVEKQTKKFEYVQVYHKAYEYVLCQVIELETDHNNTIAYCQILGYKDKGRIKKIRIPFDPGSEVLKAEDEFIKTIVKLEGSEYGGLIGKLDGKDIDVQLDLNKVLSMHMSVLAKSGSGKSYAVGVLLEEMIDKKIPLIIIDPHGEYNTLKYKNDEQKDVERLTKFGLQAQGFNVEEYGDIEINRGVKPLKLELNMQQEEILNLLPGKLNSSQLALLYSAFKYEPSEIDGLLLALDQEESNSKYSVMNMIEYIKDLKVFTNSNVNYANFVKKGSATIINLKGINPDVQEIIVYKLAKELFELRKKEKIPPFFFVIEEAHNYCPERSFGETKSSKILRNIASEGRKFGLGLCIISQRPARVDKSVLSQCSTQLILKVTNPNDLKALSNSVEGLTGNTEKEIQNLVIGQGLITGITDMPLLVNIRPRKSKHGGTSKDIIQEDFTAKLEEFKEEEFKPLIKPNIEPKDVMIIEGTDKLKYVLLPCYQLTCEDSSKSYKLLVERVHGGIITNKDELKTKRVPDMKLLNKEQISILKEVFKNKSIKETDYDKEQIKSLVAGGFITRKNDRIELGDKYAFSKLYNFENHDKIGFEQVKYDEVIEANKSKEDIIKEFEKFTKIKEVDEVFLLRYEPL
ncbi:MAG: ATP-binding protein [Candidatus Woesearchaeota archaeon]